MIDPTASGQKWIARLDDRVLCASAWRLVKSARLENSNEWALRSRLGDATVGRITGAEIKSGVLRRITPKHCNRHASALTVYQGQEGLGTVVKSVGHNYASTAGSTLIGVFRSRIEAAPTTPAKGCAS
jgi:hypothetical protein